jgi:hypothetical protein
MCEELFIKNCNENNIDEAKKIYHIDLNIDFNQLFLAMCEKGNLCIIEWFIELNKKDNLLSFDNNESNDSNSLQTSDVESINTNENQTNRLDSNDEFINTDTSYEDENLININNYEINNEDDDDSDYYSESSNELYSNDSNSFNIEYLSFRYACTNGHLDIAKKLYNLFIIQNINNEWINMIFNECCQFGHLYITLWLHNTFNINFEYEDDESITPFVNACLNGHLEIAQWIYQVDSNILNKDTFCHNDAFVLSCENGHLKIAQWLLEIKPDIDIHKFNEYAFYRVCQFGHLEIAQWLYNMDKNFNLRYNEEFNDTNENYFTLVCLGGYLDLAKWIYSIDNEIINNIDISLVFEKSCNNGYFELLQWLLNTFSFIDLKNIDDIFYTSCIKGYIQISKWIYKMSPMIDILIDQSIIVKICINGYLNVAKWLYEIDNNILTIDNNLLNTMIIDLCSKGYLDIIMWIYEKKSFPFDIFNKCFYEACINGHFETAKWLKNINNNIDFNEKIFILVCTNNFIEIAQWLYQINPDLNLRYNNDKAIRFSCYKCNYQIVKWLTSLLPEVYEFEMKRGKVIKFNIILKLIIEKEKKSVEKKDDCSICNSKLSEIITHCNHQYCYHCLNEWYNKSNDFNCPLCRENIEKIYNIE